MSRNPAELDDALDRARRDVGLSHGDLWFRYFELGGKCPAIEVEAFVYGALAPSEWDADLLALALNERYAETGRDHPLPYSDD
jgi:hypothetical protein